MISVHAHIYMFVHILPHPVPYILDVISKDKYISNANKSLTLFDHIDEDILLLHDVTSRKNW